VNNIQTDFLNDINQPKTFDSNIQMTPKQSNGQVNASKRNLNNKNNMAASNAGALRFRRQLIQNKNG
jgi:hypothetical protein